MQQFEKISSLEHLEQVYILRARVHIEHGVDGACFPNGRWEESIDASATHFGLIQDGEVVAAARVSIHDDISTVPDAEIYQHAGLDLNGKACSLN